jgi:hypothetical protein
MMRLILLPVVALMLTMGSVTFAEDPVTPTAEQRTLLEKYGKEAGLTQDEINALTWCDPVKKQACKGSNSAQKKACDLLSGDEQIACHKVREAAYNRCMQAAGCD